MMREVVDGLRVACNAQCVFQQTVTPQTAFIILGTGIYICSRDKIRYSTVRHIVRLLIFPLLSPL